MAAKAKQKTFEEKLAQVEQTVSAIEKGDLPMEKALEAYVAARGSLQELQQELQNVRQQITVLRKTAQGEEELPMEGMHEEV